MCVCCTVIKGTDSGVRQPKSEFQLNHLAIFKFSVIHFLQMENWDNNSYLSIKAEVFIRIK